MRHHRLPLLLALTATCLFVACESDDDDDDIFGPVVEEPTDPPPPPPPPAFTLDPAVGPVTTGAWYRPGPDITWQWQLDGAVNTAYDVDLYDVDYEQPSGVINALKQRGVRVICYFSAGSAESWRPDFTSFPEAVLGNPLDGWDGERYVDIRREEVYAVMLARLDASANKGCDGVELDNVVTFDDDSGFPLTRNDQLAFNRNLANEAHKRGLAIALKNAGVLVDDLVAYYDFEINEECHQYEECSDYAAFREAGKAILNTEYAADAAAAEAQRASICPAAASHGTRTLILPLGLDDSFRVACFEGSTPKESDVLYRFGVIGDYGDEDDDTQAVAAMMKGWGLDYVFTVGDNDYSDGAFKGTFAGLELGVGQYFSDFIGNYQGSYGAGSEVNRFFPAPGDHDWGDFCPNPTGLDDYLRYFTLPDENSGNERYYDVRVGPVHFFSLDSVDECEPDGVDAESKQAQWVRDAAAASDAPFKFALSHHPPYSSGTHVGDGEHMRWPWKEWGFTTVISGHDHNYERLEVDGMTYLVNGVGGNGLRDTLTPVPGSLVRYSASHGAMLFEVYENRIVGSLITVDGMVVDQFELGGG